MNPRTFKRMGAVAAVVALALAAAPPITSEAGGFPGPAPSKLAVSAIRGVNYFPSQLSWSNQWRADPAGDFNKMRQAGLNTVRLLLQPSAVGWPVPDPSILFRLVGDVNLAQSYGLYVDLTLFDNFGNWDQTANAKTWATQVLASFRNSTELVAIEVNDNIDPWNPSQMAWLDAVMPTIRQSAGTVPVTTSVLSNSPEAPRAVLALKTALSPANRPDFYTVHFQGQPQNSAGVFYQATRDAAPASVLIGATGVSSQFVSPSGAGGSEAAQADYATAVVQAARIIGLPVMWWAWQDSAPAGIPADAGNPAGLVGWGLFRLDGTAKPASAIMLAAAPRNVAAG
jgi:hypothetical protein